MIAKHCRNRSLIPVKDLEKLDARTPSLRVMQSIDDEDDDASPQTSHQRRNLIMIYLLLLAEAIMAYSLSFQIGLLLPSTFSCSTVDSSFLRSILQCAYFFGSATGIAWGFAADQLGRKPVALIGLFGMSMCCITMGFATSFVSLVFLRYVAGAISSAATVAALAMLADSTYDSQQRRISVVAKVPLITAVGQLGPFLAMLVGDRFHDFFADYPGLGSQMFCAGLVVIITIAESFLLEETLAHRSSNSRRTKQHFDSEKAAFLGQSLSDDSEESLNIRVIDTCNSKVNVKSLPSYISLAQMFTAPSVLILLISFSVLSLHAATFEVMLPQLSTSASEQGSMGMPCSWLNLVTITVRVFSAWRIMYYIPALIRRIGLLSLYRRISVIFPALYIAMPLLALAVHAVYTALASTTPQPETNSSIFTVVVPAALSVAAMLAKTLLAGAAQVCVLLLTFRAAPDASSTGTLIAVVSISHLFQALGVGLTGLVYFVSADVADSLPLVSLLPWLALALVALLSAVVTLKLRETPRVGTDFGEDVFVWQGFFDVERGVVSTVPGAGDDDDDLYDV